MQYSVECEKKESYLYKFSFKVPREEINRLIEKGYEKAQKNVQLKGFRTGHAPLQLVKAYCKSKVHQQVIQRILTQSYLAEVYKKGLQVLNAPEMEFWDENEPLKKSKNWEAALDLKDSGDFNFSASIEIQPQIELEPLTNLSQLKLKLSPPVITEEQVDSFLSELCSFKGKLVSLRELALKQGLDTNDHRGAKLQDCVKFQFERFQFALPEDPLDQDLSQSFHKYQKQGPLSLGIESNDFTNTESSDPSAKFFTRSDRSKNK